MVTDLQMIFRVFTTASEQDLVLPDDEGPAMLYVERGTATIAGVTVRAGDGVFLADGQERLVRGAGRLAIWSLGRAAAAIPVAVELQMQFPIDPPGQNSLFRLDSVGFPPGARAYRHVHPGPGIRYLVDGELEVRGDQHSQTIAAGQAWFEAANSPVTAICPDDRPSRFMRAHLLPVDYWGKATIRYLDDEDSEKPKLQTTHRFCEHLVAL